MQKKSKNKNAAKGGSLEFKTFAYIKNDFNFIIVANNAPRNKTGQIKTRKHEMVEVKRLYSESMNGLTVVKLFTINKL